MSGFVLLAGEYISVSVATGSSVSISNNSAKSIMSISLTAGDWDVSATLFFKYGGATAWTELASSISQTDNTLNANPGNFVDQTPGGTGATNGSYSQTIAPVRISLASTTTIYLVGYALFSVSTLSGWGYLSARRAR